MVNGTETTAEFTARQRAKLQRRREASRARRAGDTKKAKALEREAIQLQAGISPERLETIGGQRVSISVSKPGQFELRQDGRVLTTGTRADITKFQAQQASIQAQQPLQRVGPTIERLQQLREQQVVREEPIISDRIEPGPPTGPVTRKVEEFTGAFTEGFTLQPTAEQRVRAGTGTEAVGFTLGATAAVGAGAIGKVVGGAAKAIPGVPFVASKLNVFFASKPVQVVGTGVIAADIGSTAVTQGSEAAARRAATIGRDVALFGGVISGAQPGAGVTRFETLNQQLFVSKLGGKPKRLSKAELRQRGRGLQTKQEQQQIRQEAIKQQRRLPSPPPQPRRPETVQFELGTTTKGDIRILSRQQIFAPTRKKTPGEKAFERTQKVVGKRVQQEITEGVALQRRPNPNQFLGPTKTAAAAAKVEKGVIGQGPQVLKLKGILKEPKPVQSLAVPTKTGKVQEFGPTRQKLETQKKRKQDLLATGRETFIEPPVEGQRGVLPPREQLARARLSQLLEARKLELAQVQEVKKVPQQTFIEQVGPQPVSERFIPLEFTPELQLPSQPLPVIEKPVSAVSILPEQLPVEKPVEIIREDVTILPDISQAQEIAPITIPVQPQAIRPRRRMRAEQIIEPIPVPPEPLAPTDLLLVQPVPVKPIDTLIPEQPLEKFVPLEFTGVRRPKRIVERPIRPGQPRLQRERRPSPVLPFTFEVGRPGLETFFTGRAATLGEAISKARRGVETTPAATLRIRRDEKEIEFEEETVQRLLGPSFRPGKTGGVIQRREKRISTTGELLGITAKGIAARTKRLF